jgi:RNase adaptor protein for sRNA GlmZ degradation
MSDNNTILICFSRCLAVSSLTIPAKNLATFVGKLKFTSNYLQNPSSVLHHSSTTESKDLLTEIRQQLTSSMGNVAKIRMIDVSHKIGIPLDKILDQETRKTRDPKYQQDLKREEDEQKQIEELLSIRKQLLEQVSKLGHLEFSKLWKKYRHSENLVDVSCSQYDVIMTCFFL